MGSDPPTATRRPLDRSSRDGRDDGPRTVDGEEHGTTGPRKRGAPAQRRGSARRGYEERDKGSVAAGKLADFVVLERDPHDADPDDIKNIGVVRTVVGGRTVHAA